MNNRINSIAGYFLLILFLLCILSFVNAKSYSLDKAEVNVKINEDGLVKAEEKISFNFSENFSFAYRDIPKGSWQLSNVEVFEGNRPVRFELINQGGDWRVKWYYSAENEVRTFTIKYELRKAVTAYNDVGEFNWKVWGEG
ncbi:MAG: DUF2207 domain-containing protein, partial [archaeon]